jgi:hypothetical protein
MTDLNKESAEKIMGWTLESIERSTVGYWVESGEKTACVRYEEFDWTPLTDLNQCFQIVEKMRELGFSFELSWWIGSKSWYVCIDKKDEWGAYISGPHEYLSSTPNEAILTAALEAVGEMANNELP